MMYVKWKESTQRRKARYALESCYRNTPAMSGLEESSWWASSSCQGDTWRSWLVASSLKPKRSNQATSKTLSLVQPIFLLYSNDLLKENIRLFINIDADTTVYGDATRRNIASLLLLYRCFLRRGSLVPPVQTPTARNHHDTYTESTRHRSLHIPFVR